MKNNKRYTINKSTFMIMIFLVIICTLFYIFCSLQISIRDNIDTNTIALYETIKNVLLVIISVLGVNLFSSVLIEVKSKNNYLSEIMANDVISSPEFYNHMDIEVRQKMFDALEKSLYLKYDISYDIYKNIKDEIKNSLTDYYYTEGSFNVSCTIHDNYIEKEIMRTIKIRSYEKTISLKGFNLANFSAKKINGLDAFSIQSIKINNHSLTNSDYSLTPATSNNLDEQNEYNVFVDCIYNNTLNINSSEDVIITMSYITRTSKDDRLSTFRVGQPCKNFNLFFSIKQHENYRIVANAYGFLDDADNSNNNSSKSEIHIKFDNWIYKYDGATIVILDK